jgi:hypothetical protein
MQCVFRTVAFVLGVWYDLGKEGKVILSVLLPFSRLGLCLGPALWVHLTTEFCQLLLFTDFQLRPDFHISLSNSWLICFAKEIMLCICKHTTNINVFVRFRHRYCFSEFFLLYFYSFVGSLLCSLRFIVTYFNVTN